MSAFRSWMGLLLLKSLASLDLSDWRKLDSRVRHGLKSTIRHERKQTGFCTNFSLVDITFQIERL